MVLTDHSNSVGLIDETIEGAAPVNNELIILPEVDKVLPATHRMLAIRFQLRVTGISRYGVTILKRIARIPGGSRNKWILQVSSAPELIGMQVPAETLL